MEKRITRLLVANRGEIAVRIITTCRKMGISPVAVYSDADRDSPHVRAADLAIHLGPSPAAESYLNIERILDAARRSGADAIHPGYGFLSENADFAAACETAGIAFIGPSADVIRRMGLKSVGRSIARDAEVAVIPGYDGEDQSQAALHEAILRTGFPALIKASAAGGGRGMRVVQDQSEIDAAIQSARREATSAFSDGSLLVEELIENPRHVEIQIVGDHHGNLVHLLERECSVQRRYQKLVEESPSPALTADLRDQMGEAALRIARAIGYTSAGTVEFILAPTGRFYFIEVNTRLQVEHPVTEMIAGLDIVRLQIEIAEGEPLPISQEDVWCNGHAIEARIYAEDPEHEFLPASGTLCDWHAPSIDGLRVDSGVARGSQVGIHYDSLLAKLIAHGADREAARRKLVAGLREIVISGVSSNREFLVRVLEHERFRAGQYGTAFVGEQIDELIGGADPELDFTIAVAATLYLQKTWHSRYRTLPQIPPVFRNNPYRDPSVKLQIGAQGIDLDYRHIGEETYRVSCTGRQVHAKVVSFEPENICLEIDGIQRGFRVALDGDRMYVHSSLGARTVTRFARFPERQAAAGEGSASAPMPGQVLKILVSEGQQVSAGDPLVVLEAMKIEQTLRASVQGTVEAVHVKAGDVVSPGEVLVQITAN